MIYILEDDASIEKLITYTLNKEGMEPKGFDVPSKFYKALEEKIPDLILLDIMLPEEDGLTVLKTLKKDIRYKDIPVIMLTARSSEFDKVTGLDSGADDYVAKPFGMMELISRIRAVLRRYQKSNDEGYEYKGLYISKDKHLVKYKDEEITLTRKEFDMLYLLMSREGMVFTRDELLNQVWGYEYDDSNRTVDVHIRTLRSKLKDAGNYIETIRGVGYRIGG